MKKLLVSTVTAAAILCASLAPAFADVIRTSGSTGQPVAAVSNPGSAEAQQNRSDTGTTNKISHDGIRLVVE
jgi:hypothetical protein